MPFKSGKSPTDVSKRIKQILETDLPKDIEKGLFSMYTVLSGAADFYVPVDTSALVQSRTYRIRKEAKGWKLTYGYYSDYAHFLYYNTDWKPKAPGTPGKPNGGYNPNAQPRWMDLAWTESGTEAVNVFAGIIGH